MKVVVVTPNVGDGEIARDILAEQRIEVVVLPEIGRLGEVAPWDMGCLVLVEEALVEPAVDDLRAMLVTQPPWSDLPLLIIAGNASPLLEQVTGLFAQSANVTLLQRPIHPASLVTSTHAALRSRTRQLQVRDLLEQRTRAVRRRDEFLAMLAHELRNPLSPIRNAVYLLGTLEHEDPLFAKCRAMIDKQSRNITRLVDDLLDVSRLELGKVELRLQRIDFNDGVGAGVEACAAINASRRHVVSTRLARRRLPVHADPVRLEQAVCNLLVNAAKFTPEGGRIELETREENGHAVLTVTDNGVGIKKEMLDSIFDLFTQDAVTLARTQGGLGIGLTLVRRLVELHGGTVKASSEGLGSGSRFEVRLPLDRHTEVPASVPSAVPVAPPKRVLIIEDGGDNRDSLGLLITGWKHEVIYAASGPEGLDRARETHPDVALIDIGLPGFDGYQVARRIRRDGSAWGRHVRLIALTGYGQANDRERAMDAGFDVHVLKPVDPVELRRLIN